MKKNLFEKLGLLLAVIMGFVPYYLAPVCGGIHDSMSCSYSANLVIKFAIALVAINLGMILLSKNNFGKGIKVLGSLIIIIIAALSYMIPHGIIEVINPAGKPYGFCKMPTMGCVVHNTFGVVGTVAGIIAIIAIANIIYIFLKKD